MLKLCRYDERAMRKEQSFDGHTFLLTNEVAGILRIHVETVRRAIRCKRLDAIKVGRHWRVQQTEIGRINKKREL